MQERFFVIKILVQVLDNKLVYKSINIHVYAHMFLCFVFRRIGMRFM